MKTVFIMTDTFRRDHLGAYGNPWIKTPNLDLLASVSTVFDQYYVGSFPTLPNRRDMALGHGQPDNAFNDWKRIEPYETTLAQRLEREKKIHSMMINDTRNSVTGEMNFFKGFSGYEVNRGQEGDGWISDFATPLEFPVEPHLIRYKPEMWHRCLMNRAAWRHEEDFFAPRTFKMAGEWLERNYKREDFFLWVETFDPHEPWDPPQWYVDMYDPGYTGRFFGSPTYGVHKEYGITDREAKNIHACYCGEVTMIDSAVGRLMHTLEKLGILNETNIVFTTDHGTCMSQEGDGGVIGKALFVGADGMMNSGTRKLEPPIRFFPMRTGICRIPLFLHRAGQTRTRRISRIAQPWDITPTVLDLYGIAPAPEFYGESLLPLTEGKRMKPRLCALQGSEKGSQLIRQAANADWLLTEWPGSGLEPWLVDLKNNPKQDKNAAKKHPAVVKQLHEAMVRFDPRAFGAGA